jgi:pSer/pThr/pTyr-binding forkhead associated (FHA) protein
MSLFEIEQAQAVATEKAPRRAQAGVRFTVKFEDGNTVTVGEIPGVMGVKPAIEGESLFRIVLEDPTDTVAPEHCEFGVDNGVFWVKDLKTVNGTVVEEPGAPLLQCIPYDKYFVVRGSRVGLGSLFFTLH